MANSKNNSIRKDFLVFGQPDIREDEINEVIHTLKSKWIGTGPKSKLFEKQFAEYVGINNAVAVNSCTAGLHLSLIASGIKHGDEVITTPMTFSATANVIHHVGAKPVFADVDYDSMNISPEKIKEKITKNTKAIIVVHVAGYPCDMDEIMKIANKYNLIVIEDAAHAIGTEYKGKKIGSLGQLTCFSFYPTKNITTIEGGMVTTPNNELAERIRILSNHGLSRDAWKRFSDELIRDYETIEPGFKYNMTDVQASLGIHQLKRLEENIKRREEIWKQYNEAFSGLPLETPNEPKNNSRHARHLYMIRLDLDKLKINRNEFRKELYIRKIGTGVHYTALHLHHFYKTKHGHRKEDFPIAEKLGDRIISLPLSSALTEEDVNDVIKAVKDVCNNYKK